MKRFILLIVLCFVLSGCATTYIYSGSLIAPDWSGAERKHVLCWENTEGRLFYKDKYSKRIDLLTNGTTRNLVFTDIEGGGIVFRRTPDDKGAFSTPVELNGLCGKIERASSVGELKEGDISVSIMCRASSSRETRQYIKAQEEYHVFKVSKREAVDRGDVKAECSRKYLGLR